jgi:hypothetical protein
LAPVLCEQRRLLERLLDDHRDLVHLKRLHQAVVGEELHRLDHGLRARVAVIITICVGEALPLHFAQDGHPIDLGHLQVRTSARSKGALLEELEHLLVVLALGR